MHIVKSLQDATVLNMIQIMIHLQLTAYLLDRSFLDVYVCAANHSDNSGSQTQWAF